MEPLASISGWICGTQKPTAGLSSSTEGPGAVYVVCFFVIGVLLTFALLVLLMRIWHARIAARKNVLSHHCDQCGYDLRITPDPHGPLHTRCPECGNINALRTQPISDTNVL